MTAFKKQILIVCRDKETAAKIWNMRDYSDVRAMSIHANHTGLRFDLIIVPTIESESAVEQAVIDDIIENVLPLHLRPDGRIVRI